VTASALASHADFQDDLGLSARAAAASGGGGSGSGSGAVAAGGAGRAGGGGGGGNTDVPNFGRINPKSSESAYPQSAEID
jgi:hypothetical protein